MPKFSQDDECTNELVSFFQIMRRFVLSYFGIQNKVILQDMKLKEVNKKHDEDISSIRTEMNQLIVRSF